MKLKTLLEAADDLSRVPLRHRDAVASSLEKVRAAKARADDLGHYIRVLPPGQQEIPPAKGRRRPTYRPLSEIEPEALVGPFDSMPDALDWMATIADDSRQGGLAAVHGFGPGKPKFMTPAQGTAAYGKK